ncbi:3-oxoacyl-ACP reductase FabG [Microbulbifer elongatus]|uniref:3-oxoacyl-ACP reductase FabG n=1 Tax=Microbulbifer elongatus TaxID=86173 RepID=A0ABT1P3L7_9GAMM|nr:3-oxoacyl-ACP reductase FabG [Microbulbifer elongatus]MCQ3830713.1 3-oxoacyl-ACP reductase FabG [Microbulbifer elongatus]
MYSSLKDKTVIVTGGTRGIGKGIVDALCQSGAKVIFTYRSNEALARDIEGSNVEAGRHCRGVQADVSDPAQCQALVDDVVTQEGNLYALVNNAGITADQAFMTMPAENWDSVIGTNLSGSAYMTQAALKQMIHQDCAKVLFVSSVSGLQASAGQANYSASKAGLVGLTKTLSHEMARFGVQVNCIAPGFIRTDMVEQMNEQAMKKLTKMIPARRVGEVSEVAKATLFLLSDHADYITGQTLVIDGGLSA